MTKAACGLTTTSKIESNVLPSMLPTSHVTFIDL